MTRMRGKPPLARYPDVDFYTAIAGIPCGIVVTHYAPEQYNSWGHPDHRLPDDPEEVEFVVVDRNGYEADWLRAKESEVRLESHVLDLINHGRSLS